MKHTKNKKGHEGPESYEGSYKRYEGHEGRHRWWWQGRCTVLQVSPEHYQLVTVVLLIMRYYKQCSRRPPTRQSEQGGIPI